MSATVPVSTPPHADEPEAPLKGPVPSLTESQTAALEAIKTKFAGADGLGMALDDNLFLRYLRARDYNTELASAMLQATLDWRRDFGVERILSGEELETIKRENATGKVYVRGYDKQGRVCLIMRPSKQNTYVHDDQLKHLVYHLERARLIMQKKTAGSGKLCMLMDFAGYGVSNAPPMKTSRATLSIVQDHYPEMLGACFMISPPMLFTAFWKVIYPFIDVVTREKIKFVSGSPDRPAAQAILEENFNLDTLEVPLGGRNAEPFDSATYLAGPMDVCFEECRQDA